MTRVRSMHNSTTERFCIGSQGGPGLHAGFCFVFIFKISALRDCLNILEAQQCVDWYVCWNLSFTWMVLVGWHFRTPGPLIFSLLVPVA